MTGGTTSPERRPPRAPTASACRRASGRTAHPDVVALPRGPLRPAHAGGARGVGRGRPRHRRASSRSPWWWTRRRWTRPAALLGLEARRAPRRRHGVRPHRPPPHPPGRLLDPRQRPHLRARRRRPRGRRPVPLRRLERAVHALRQGRRGAGAHRRGLGRASSTRRRSCSRAAPSTPTARARCSPPSSACCTTATSA